jgi:hypothetical protein
MAGKQGARADFTKVPDTFCDIPVEDRIRFIVQEMVAGRWHNRRMYECAQQWNVSVSTVKWNASEASRQVRRLFTPEELQDLKVQAIAFLENMAHDCKAEGKAREAIQAVGQLAEIAGWKVHKHEFSGPGGAAIVVQGLKNLSEDAVEDRILLEAEAIAKKRALRAQAAAGRGDLAPRAPASAAGATSQAPQKAPADEKTAVASPGSADAGPPADPGPSLGDG